MALETELEKKLDGLIKVLSLKGSLDTETASDLEKQLDTLFQTGTKAVIFDMAELDYVSSAGLRVVFKAAKPADQDSRFSLLFSRCLFDRINADKRSGTVTCQFCEFEFFQSLSTDGLLH